MTDMRTDFDMSLIEHLDFAPPCEVVLRDRSNPEWHPCNEGAEWIVTYRHHCIPDATKTRLVCERHLAEWSSPTDTSECESCGEHAVVADYIIRTERIGA